MAAAADRLGNIREDIGSLKAQVEALARIVEHQVNTSAQGRARIYEKLEEIERKLDRAEGSIVALTKRVDAIEPTVEDYRTRMIQVKAAGWLGRLLWMIGGILLTGAASLATNSGWIGKFLRGDH
jgi:phage shock protein A